MTIQLTRIHEALDVTRAIHEAIRCSDRAAYHYQLECLEKAAHLAAELSIDLRDDLHNLEKHVDAELLNQE